MKTVFVVQHVHQLAGDNEDVKFIGVYATEEKARAAIARLTTQPGFSSVPDGFSIDEYELDKDNWQEGFVTVD